MNLGKEYQGEKETLIQAKMRTSLTLFASAMLATAPFVLAGEDAWIAAHSTCTDEHTPHPSHYPQHTPYHSYYPHHTPPASYYPSYTGTGSYYPWLPATTVTVSVTVYPELCASTPSSTPGAVVTASVVPQPSNSTGNSSTPSYVPSPPNATYGNSSSNSTNGTIPGTTGGAAPMGTSFTAGIVGALGVLFALL